MARPTLITVAARMGAIALCLACGNDAAGRPLGSQAEIAAGERLFHGVDRVALAPGNLASALPPQFSACSACHSALPPAQGALARNLETKQAPPLNRSSLLHSRARRGGPPFAFDRTTFCATVQSGVDPQAIIMRKTMPRFVLSDAQCSALWAYLTGANEHE